MEKGQQLTKHKLEKIYDGLIMACPCQLFKVIDDKINHRLVGKEEDIYTIMNWKNNLSELEHSKD
jgi:hypothetical protein